MHLRGHPVGGAVDRLDQVPTLAAGVVEVAEARGTAEVYELDDAGGHEHDVVPLQVAVDHPVLVEVGHTLQDLMAVQ